MVLCSGCHRVYHETCLKEQLSEENLPKNAQDLGRHAMAIAVKLKQKGIGPSMLELPAHVQKALQTLQDAADA